MAPLLSPRKRGKIVAHVLDGKTYKEIAQKYSMAKVTVAYTVQRERLNNTWNTQKSLPTGRRPHKMTERSKRWLAREIRLFPQFPLGLFCKGSGRLRDHCEESSWLDGPPQKDMQKEALSL